MMGQGLQLTLLGCAALILAGCDQGERRFEAQDLEFSDSASEAGAQDVPGDEKMGDTAETAEETMQEMAQPVACAQGERTLFFCEAGRKQIAVCGVTDAKGKPSAQYRYGSDTAELVLADGRFASVPYSGGGESQIEFVNDATRYIVYSRTVRTNFKAGEPNDPEMTDGVMVVRGGKVLSDKQCTSDPQSVDVMAGDDYGGVASELFYPED